MNQGTPTYVMLVCNKPPGASDLPLCQCVCCCEWDLVSQTERRAALKLVPTHPDPSPAAPYVCVMSGRLIQPCHQKPYHRWTGFSAPPRCQHGSVPTLKIPWHVFWHLINVSLNAEVVRKTNKLYLAPCQMRLSVLALRKQQKNEFLNVFPTMTELGFCNRVQHMIACCFMSLRAGNIHIWIQLHVKRFRGPGFLSFTFFFFFTHLCNVSLFIIKFLSNRKLSLGSSFLSETFNITIINIDK